MLSFFNNKINAVTIIIIGQYLIVILSVDFRKSEKLSDPSLLKKKAPEIRKVTEIMSSSLLEKSSMNKSKKAVPRIKKTEGKTIFDNLRKS